jgi:serine/threonine protein kinase
MEHCENGDMA